MEKRIKTWKNVASMLFELSMFNADEVRSIVKTMGKITIMSLLMTVNILDIDLIDNDVVEIVESWNQWFGV